MQKPQVGQAVQYFTEHEGEPSAAIIIRVNADSVDLYMLHSKVAALARFTQVKHYTECFRKGKPQAPFWREIPD